MQHIGFYVEFLDPLGLELCPRDKNGSIWLLHRDFQLNQDHLLKVLSFFHQMVLAPLSKIEWPYVCRFISRPSILFHWSSCLSRYQIQCHLSLLLYSITWDQACGVPDIFFYCWDWVMLALVLCFSRSIWEFLFLTLWRIESEFWWELHWIYRLLMVRWTFLLYSSWWSMSMTGLSIF